MAFRKKQQVSPPADDVTEVIVAEPGRDTLIFGELVPATGDAPPAPAEPKEQVKPGGWGRVFRGNKGLWITALVGVIALAGGLAIGHYVISPLDREAGDGAPPPGLVTVPVEFGELSNDLIIRGDVGFVDAAELKLDTASFEGAAIVTGQVPESGADLDGLSVALEVSGRPVIVLPGELPAYRTLAFGANGPDVTQLKESLKAVGIDPGDTSSDRFDEATATAVGALYTKVGYEPPPPRQGAQEAVTAAEDGVRAAEQMLTDAEKQLAEAGKGPTELEVLQADNMLSNLSDQKDQASAAAEQTCSQAYADAKSQAEAMEAPTQADVDALYAAADRTCGQAREQGRTQATELQRQINEAWLQRQQLDKPRDTTVEQAAVDSATKGVKDAKEALATAKIGLLPYLPSSEVLYLKELPRRVAEVNVTRGSELGTTAAMTVSGATVTITGSAAQADVALLKEGTEAFFDLPEGGQHRAVVTKIAGGSDGGRSTITFEPDPLSGKQVDELQGSNIRLNIPVGATDGEVLSVPYAALSAGPGGESRVQVVDGDPRDAENAKTRMVTVETGLAAEGYVEVTPVDGTLEAGDLVVVGS